MQRRDIGCAGPWANACLGWLLTIHGLLPAAAEEKKIVTSSLDKTLALWTSQVRGCSLDIQKRRRRRPPRVATAPVAFGRPPRPSGPSPAPDLLPCCRLRLPLPPPPHPQGNCEELDVCGFKEEARLAPPGGPIFSLALDSREQDGLPNQVRLGGPGQLQPAARRGLCSGF